MPLTETPGEKMKRLFCESHLAERLAHTCNIFADRGMLRRGVKKMQDGTIGQPGNPAEDEPMNINIGDQTHNHPLDTAAQIPTTPATTPSTLGSTLGKIVLAAGLLCGAGGLGAVISQWISPPAATAPASPTMTDTDTDTQYELRLGTPEP